MSQRGSLNPHRLHRLYLEGSMEQDLTESIIQQESAPFNEDNVESEHTSAAEVILYAQGVAARTSTCFLILALTLYFDVMIFLNLELSLWPTTKRLPESF